MVFPTRVHVLGPPPPACPLEPRGLPPRSSLIRLLNAALASNGSTPRHIASIGLAATGLALGSSTAEAQIHYGTDLSSSSRYEWRGILRHDAAVFQPSLFLGWGEDLRVTLGLFATVAWTSVKTTEVGFRERRFGEWNPWLEVGIPLGALDAAAGWTAYFYDNSDATGATSELQDTHELFARLRLISLPLVVPQVALWHDVQAVKGGYLEGRLDIRVPGFGQLLLPVGSLFITPRVGVSFNQGPNPEKPDQAAYFAGDGVTHWGLSVTAPVGPIPLGPVEASVQLSFDIDWKIDDATRVADGKSGERGHAAWLSATVTLLGPRCRPARQLCPGPL